MSASTGSTGEHLYATRTGFVEPRPADDLLHADDPALDFTAGETSYLGFNVPEAALSVEIYHWFHSRLRTTSGGVMAFRGVKSRTAEADYLDYRNFLPETESIERVTYPTGVRVEIVEPLNEIDLGFDAPDGSLRFEVKLRAAMPAAVRADGKHFAQAMRTSGWVELDGTRYDVDGFFTRDRSWLSERAEVSHPVPPLTWGAAVFDESLAFHVVGFDDDELRADKLQWGYVWRDGELRATSTMRKITHRAADGVTPIGATLELEDSAGDHYELKGETIAMLPMSFWPNMVTHLALMRWSYGDRTGYGDYQDVVFGGHLRSVARAGGAS